MLVKEATERNTSAINHYNQHDNYFPKVSFKSPWGQWVNISPSSNIYLWNEHEHVSNAAKRNELMNWSDIGTQNEGYHNAWLPLKTALPEVSRQWRKAIWSVGDIHSCKSCVKCQSNIRPKHTILDCSCGGNSRNTTTIFSRLPIVENNVTDELVARAYAFFP